MSKGLDALEEIRYLVIFEEDYVDEDDDMIPIKVFIDEVCPEQYGCIKKELKALEIIKKYPFEVQSVVSQPTYKDYSLWFASLKDGKPRLTEEEYDLLKEVLL